LRNETATLEKSLIEIAVYSQGSISWQDAMLMSYNERQTTIKVLEEYNKKRSGKTTEQL